MQLMEIVRCSSGPFLISSGSMSVAHFRGHQTVLLITIEGADYVLVYWGPSLP
jgi:hypothetical protein